MAESIQYITQSRYFSPAFNGAIFDGPIRIYFAQFQEAQALKLYFNLQERFSDIRSEAREMARSQGRDQKRTIYVMLYPSAESFELSFELRAPIVAVSASTLDSVPSHRVMSARWNNDFVCGISGTIEDDVLSQLASEMERLIHHEMARATAAQPSALNVVGMVSADCL